MPLESNFLILLKFINLIMVSKLEICFILDINSLIKSFIFPLKTFSNLNFLKSVIVKSSISFKSKELKISESTFSENLVSL